MAKRTQPGPDSGSPAELEVQALAEQLAAKVHEAWMRQRMREGWVYGRERNDRLRQHPCLVDYGLLTEDERAIDKAVASRCIQGLLESGYQINRPSQTPASNKEDPLVSVIRQRLQFRSQLSMDALQALCQQCRALDNCPANIHLSLGEEILRRGEPLQAYDVLSVGLAKFEGQSVLAADVVPPAVAAGVPACRIGGHLAHRTDASVLLRLTQLSALALAQSGASERASQLLVQLLEQGHDTPETLGLLGRVYKDLALRSPEPNQRREKLNQALRCYQTGFERSESIYRERGELKCGEEAYYCGINVAAVHLLLGDLVSSRATAARVREICSGILAKSRKRPEHGRYWLLASLGEAELICGHKKQARSRYKEAVKCARGNWRELSSTRQQLRLLVESLGWAPGEWDRLFPRAAVMVFASPRWQAGSALPSDAWQNKLRAELKRRMAKVGVIAGYLSASSPVDIAFGEALLRQGAEVRLVLPYSREACRQVLAGHPEWQERFDALLSRATWVTDDTKRSCIDDAVNIRFAALRAFGSGRLRARRLGMDLHCWGVEGTDGTGSQDEPSFLLEHWRQTKTPWELVASRARAPGGKNRKRRGLPRPSSRAKLSTAGPDSYRVLSMLFADVRGYSKLDDVALLRFSHYFTREIALILRKFQPNLLLSRTAGDGLFLVFSEIEAAAEAAHKLRDRIAQTAWRDLDLPAHLGIRISLDAGPVYTFQDPVVRSLEVCGEFVIRAARIEPITPPNEVYASEAFTSLYVAAGGSAFRFEYVGQTQLPKGFGWTALYSVTRPP